MYKLSYFTYILLLELTVSLLIIQVTKGAYGVDDEH